MVTWNGADVHKIPDFRQGLFPQPLPILFPHPPTAAPKYRPRKTSRYGRRKKPVMKPKTATKYGRTTSRRTHPSKSKKKSNLNIYGDYRQGLFPGPI